MSNTESMLEKMWEKAKSGYRLGEDDVRLVPTCELSLSSDVIAVVIGIDGGSPSTARMPARRSWSSVPTGLVTLASL